MQTPRRVMSDTAQMAKTSRPPRSSDTAVDDTEPQVRAASPDSTGPRPGALATAVLLLRAAHPRFAVLTAAGVTAAAALSGREAREIAVVAATVLVGQAILGWHNELVDRERDQRHAVAGKPLAEGRLETGTVWFALACAVLLLVPLTVTNGITAGTSYLLAVLAGILGNVALRTGALSWLTWAVSFALLPAFLSYGGWGGQFEGDPPRISVTVLAGLLGVGVHVLVSLWGLEPDAADGWRTLPLRLGRRLGSSRLLLGVVGYLVVVVVALVAVAAGGGLSA